jgi:hypothetical protein
MHTLHWWAVEAEDKEEAFGIIKDRLITDDGTNWVEWSDWHVVGGGRWNSEGDGYTDNDNMIISYADEPDKFKERLEWCKTARKDEMNVCLERMNTDKFTSDIVDFISNGGMVTDDLRFSMNNYYIKNATDLLSDNYTSHSYFYDYVEYTAHMGYVEERLDNPDRPLIQFLVPIDFHF